MEKELSLVYYTPCEDIIADMFKLRGLITMTQNDLAKDVKKDVHEGEKASNGVLWCVTGAMEDIADKVCDKLEKLQSELQLVLTFADRLIPLDTMIKEHKEAEQKYSEWKAQHTDTASIALSKAVDELIEDDPIRGFNDMTDCVDGIPCISVCDTWHTAQFFVWNEETKQVEVYDSFDHVLAKSWGTDVETIRELSEPDAQE